MIDIAHSIELEDDEVDITFTLQSSHSLCRQHPKSVNQ